MSVARFMQMAAASGEGEVPSFSFIAYSAEGNDSPSTSFTVDYPASVAVGDIVVAACFYDGTETITSSSLPTGYTFIGSETTLTPADEYPDPILGFRIYDGTEGSTVTFPSAEIGSEPYSAILLVFRPDDTLGSLSSNYAAQNGPSALSVDIGAASASTPAIGIAISCGRPTTQTPTLTATGTDATTTVSGTGLTTGNMMFAYKLYDAGDSTSNIPTSTTDAGRQALVTTVLTLADLFSYSFDTSGSDGGLEALSVTSSDFGTGDFTCEAWVYPTDLSNNYNAVVGHQWPAGGGLFYVRGDGAVTFYDGGIILDVGAGTISTDQWYHIAAVRSSGTLTLYIDGTSVGSTSYTNSITDTNLYVGQNQNDAEEFQGYIYRPHVLDSAKYTGNFTPATNYGVEATSLMLLVTDGATAEDLKENSVTNNGATFVLSSP